MSSKKGSWSTALVRCVAQMPQPHRCPCLLWNATANSQPSEPHHPLPKKGDLLWKWKRKLVRSLIEVSTAVATTVEFAYSFVILMPFGWRIKEKRGCMGPSGQEHLPQSGPVDTWYPHQVPAPNRVAGGEGAGDPVAGDSYDEKQTEVPCTCHLRSAFQSHSLISSCDFKTQCHLSALVSILEDERCLLPGMLDEYLLGLPCLWGTPKSLGMEISPDVK